MSKFIIFCADGTWNGPDKDDNDLTQSDPTNVYKLFLGLKGELLNAAFINQADEQEKALQEAGAVQQVAKYIHGVGDFDNPIKKMMGGAFGAGTIARIVRGYTFISRNYDPGDHIVIVGFSRGAYTARALAGMIAYQGLLSKALTQDKTGAYRWGVRAWFRYRSESKKLEFLQKLEKAAIDIADLVSNTEISDSDLLPVDKIKAVAVWDTVGALGLPLYVKDNRVDVFKFTDNQLSAKVEKGFHAVALDEKREDFAPTLWNDAANVVQIVFPGAHGDVGGGYPTQNKESGLSDIALAWMVEQLENLGVQFNHKIFDSLAPDFAGTSHKPWVYPPFNAGVVKTRDELKGSGIRGILEHPSVQRRINASPVIQEPEERSTGYSPANRP